LNCSAEDLAKLIGSREGDLDQQSLRAFNSILPQRILLKKQPKNGAMLSKGSHVFVESKEELDDLHEGANQELRQSLKR